MTTAYDHATHIDKKFTEANRRPVVLSIGEHDPCGCAGVQGDARVISDLGGHGKTIASAFAHLDSDGVQRIDALRDEAFTSQFATVFPASPEQPTNMVDAVKLGLMASVSQVEFVSSVLKGTKLPMVMDPVFSASCEPTLTKAHLSELLPLAAVLSTDLDGVSLLVDQKVDSHSEVETAAKQLVGLGAKAVLIKGRQQLDSSLVHDYFYSTKVSFWLRNRRSDACGRSRPEGELSSSIATALAMGYPLEDAVTVASMALHQGLRKTYSLPGEVKAVHIGHFPDNQADLPDVLQRKHVHTDFEAFPPCTLPSGQDAPLGLYPIVDNCAWLERLLPLGVKTIQLRVKHLEGLALEEEVKLAIELAARFDARLFINDHWALAIKHKAYGVHLGQEDLDEADIVAIQRAGLRLGTSTHCHYEVARAHAYKPSYLACGPVFHTNTKQMPWAPHGKDGFEYWRGVLDVPLVAIGGINSQKVGQMLNAGADAIAMITAITKAEDPEHQTRLYLEQINAHFLGH
jgi:hydroxymethylpyrimidine kinase/phosphomethylpyrimidine kinase/thiamine-phosphate diphosphorylase